jgi:hypothetical protein
MILNKKGHVQDANDPGSNWTLRLVACPFISLDSIKLQKDYTYKKEVK